MRTGTTIGGQGPSHAAASRSEEQPAASNETSLGKRLTGMSAEKAADWTALPRDFKFKPVVGRSPAADLARASTGKGLSPSSFANGKVPRQRPSPDCFPKMR